ncbi:adhesion G protein-coupled receptor L4 [Paramormyrops kingsleyae]|uniref:Adhesion G protein-coupled receptor L4 n=1 Tax=Paramormyrops kingsleyae TaxID=1676925 RepID=A0A3B3QG91_9TELE|nr:adhesion G protein-coupled receptor L4 [Paramormyrops kingsleyae]
MESFLKFPMKLVLLAAWLSLLLDPCKFSDFCKKCLKEATCQTNNGSEVCLCKIGYTGDGISFCADDNECENVTGICGKNAYCSNIQGSYFCTCTPGYKSTGTENFQTNDDTHCVEIPKTMCHLNDKCVSQMVNKTLQSMSGNKSPLPLLKEIRKQTSEELTPVDIISYVEVLSQSLPLLSVVNDTSANVDASTNETIKVFVNTVNNIVENNAWYNITEVNQEQTITKLLHTVEEATLSISKNYKTATEVEVNTSHLALKLCAFETQHNKQLNLQANLGGDSIKLQSAETKVNENVSVVFLRYTSISNLLKNSKDKLVQEYKQHSEAEDFTVNSQVVAVALKPANVYELDVVTFSLKHSEPFDSDRHSVKCAFWKYSESMRGHWATDGCKYIHVNTSHTTCSCNHMTHFAILMSSGRSEVTDHLNILTRLTQLGMIISIICLSMCIFTFWFFSEIQSTRTTIHKNLCCSLFMAEFIFLVGINMSNHKHFCSIVAMLLHYFFLAAFAWMCIEGIHLYLIVVGVIYNKGFLHRNFYIFGYGSPAVVVAISATLGYKYYGTKKACWLSTENNFIWSFIGPACLIILVNLLAFGVIMYKVYRHTAIKKPEISHYENIRSCARGALALLFVLGATWTFGVLHILQETTVTAYLFTICNTFQGMFIFIFLCVLSRKIQEEYYRLFKNVPCCFECLR